MPIPLDVIFRGMEPSPALETEVAARVEHLEHLYDRILRCRVTVDSPHHHQQRGRLFNIHVALSVPGREITVDHAHPHDAAHKDVYVALADAFEAAKRQLQDHARIARHDVKSHV